MGKLSLAAKLTMAHGALDAIAADVESMKAHLDDLEKALEGAEKAAKA